VATLEVISDEAILIVMKGRLGAEHGRRLAAELQAAMAAPPPKRTFWDLEELEQYHSEVRTRCTEALLSNLGNLIGLTVVARSKIVRMGVAVANVALGGRATMVDRAAFDLALRTARTRG
jgi:hypothetical protein